MADGQRAPLWPRAICHSPFANDRPSTQTGKAARSRAWCLWVRLPLRSVKGGRPEENQPGWLPSAFLLPPSHFLLPPPIPWSNGTTPVRHTGDDGSTPSGINHKRAHGPTARRQLGRLLIRVRLPVSPLIQHGRQPDTVGRTALLTRFSCTGDEGSNPSPSASSSCQPSAISLQPIQSLAES